MSNTDQLLTQIKLSTDYQTNKVILQEKLKTDLHLAYNGGLFALTPALLAFVSTWPADTLYLQDAYENPIEITKSEFLPAAQQQYQKAMNYCHIQHAELKRLRKL